jgi:hypothetical protein
MRRLLRWANWRYGMRRGCVALGCAALAFAWPASVKAQTPRAQSGASDLPANPDKAPVTEPIFQFHSGFWLNLHHALYLQARLREGELISRSDNGAGAKSAAIPKDADSNSAAWQAAVDYYVKNLAHRDLLFDGGMMLIKNRLAELEACPDLSGKTTPGCSSGLQPGMIDALEGAAPVYRARWWPADDQKNREWMGAVTPYIKQMGSSVAEQLASIYRSNWPRDPIRVDVVAYAGPFGAYTTLDPVYVTVSSTDPRNQGLSAFEILFHEGSHALSTKVQDQIVEVCHERDIPIPRDLWHALLFYTTGEVVRRTLARGEGSVSAGTRATTYMPYAYRNGLYTLGWGTYQRALEAYWQPYLDGRDSFDHAIAQVVRAL